MTTPATGALAASSAVAPVAEKAAPTPCAAAHAMAPVAAALASAASEEEPATVVAAAPAPARSVVAAHVAPVVATIAASLAVAPAIAAAAALLSVAACAASDAEADAVAEEGSAGDGTARTNCGAHCAAEPGAGRSGESNIASKKLRNVPAIAAATATTEVCVCSFPICRLVPHGKLSPSPSPLSSQW